VEESTEVLVVDESEEDVAADVLVPVDASPSSSASGGEQAASIAVASRTGR
jgi:hypothetical protein